MNRFGRVILILVLLLVAGSAGYWMGHRHGGDEKADAKSGDDSPTTEPADDSEHVVVDVEAAPLKMGKIEKTITAFGTVSAEPGEVRVISVPFESRVKRVLVTPGQEVPAGAEVAQVAASPDAAEALQEARNAVEVTSRDAEQAEQRFNEHLATNQERSQAQQVFQSAKFKLESLEKRGVGSEQHLKTEAAGVVSKVDVQEGQIVGAGGALIEVAAENRFQVKLGVEPEDAASLKPDQSVSLRRVEGSNDKTIEGHIRLISKSVNPNTRLIDVFVEPKSNEHLILETFIEAHILRSADGLIVPREAVQPEEDGVYAIYTIKDGHASRHAVKLGIENLHDVQLIGDDLKEGDLIAIGGSYVLEDGMEVKIKEAATQPSATESPATEPTTAESTPAQPTKAATEPEGTR